MLQIFFYPGCFDYKSGHITVLWYYFDLVLGFVNPLIQFGRNPFGSSDGADI